MAVKPKIGKNSTPTNANMGCIPPQAITHQLIERELFKPCKDGESLVVRNEKNLFQIWMSVFY